MTHTDLRITAIIGTMILTGLVLRLLPAVQ